LSSQNGCTQWINCLGPSIHPSIHPSKEGTLSVSFRILGVCPHRVSKGLVDVNLIELFVPI
jgi:hypothetical protein